VTRIRQIAEQRGEDFNELLIQYTNLINAIVDSRPAGMRICMHLCRGNQGNGIASGGYEPIADFLYGRMDVDAYFLEYDTERAGDFTPLRFMPKNKQVVLGMISTKLRSLSASTSLSGGWRRRANLSIWIGYVSVHNAARPLDFLSRGFRSTIRSASSLIWWKLRTGSGVDLSECSSKEDGLGCGVLAVPNRRLGAR
jgi:hypothetical protein